MADYREIEKSLKEGGICKAVVGDYVIYKRNWLYENLEQEITLIKSAREWQKIKEVDFDRLKAARDSLRKYLQEQEKEK